jgi:hypothetical protein
VRFHLMTLPFVGCPWIGGVDPGPWPVPTHAPKDRDSLAGQLESCSGYRPSKLLLSRLGSHEAIQISTYRCMTWHLKRHIGPIDFDGRRYGEKSMPTGTIRIGRIPTGPLSRELDLVMNRSDNLTPETSHAFYPAFCVEPSPRSL